MAFYNKLIVFVIVLCVLTKKISATVKFTSSDIEVDLGAGPHGDSSVINVLRDNVIIQRILLDADINFEKIVDKSDFSMFRITHDVTKDDHTIITDCFSLDENTTHWYGGPQQKKQLWPVEKLKLDDYSYVTKEADNCAIAERYWLNSHGVFIYVDDEAPLFIDQNSEYPGYMCLRAKKQLPYDIYTSNFTFSYSIGIGTDSKKAHMEAVKRFFGRPSGIPDERMIQHPIWSTWARYKYFINESVVLEYADEIIENDFKNSQLEIDDDWEICYGALSFNKSKFPNMKNTVELLKIKGFRVTLWVHPFINQGCEPWYSEAENLGYFVKDHNNSTTTSWWNSRGNKSAYIDFTISGAADWFHERLLKLQENYGIDSFKFDAGESSWSPVDSVLNGPPSSHPNLITTEYIREVAKFGPMIEVRSGQNSQDLPVFLRITDKDSLWTWNNGLPTLITTLLQLNMVGYSFVLPDMIGGNGYEGAPSKELYIRWLQANVFMPTLQFSYVPWDYDEETIEIAKKFVKLHEKFSDEILKRFNLAVETGEPVNPPMWWIDPTDKNSQGINDRNFILNILFLYFELIFNSNLQSFFWEMI